MCAIGLAGEGRALGDAAVGGGEGARRLLSTLGMVSPVEYG